MLMRRLKQRVEEFTRTRFGLSVLMDRKERAMRVLEEALELAQAEGVEWGQIEKVCCVVRDRPKGDPLKEAPQVLLTLIAWSVPANAALDLLVEEELKRVMAKPIEHFRQRHREKQALGISRGND